MSNFRLNLPIDIPWKLIDSSSDMMDRTFCDKKYPNPFQSSLAIYAYEPKVEELPEELCGDRITYLKVSCTIAGYQPTGVEKEQIVSLLEDAEVDYSKIEQIIGEYFGCYGVLLNVSVHPDKDLKDDLDNYPRIVDFEPKTRDFYQAASETGEILSTSFGKVSTNKSYGSTDSTESSWQTGANASISPEEMMALTGVPVGVGVNGTTGQTRTETEQQNWSIQTDASRERKENQSTTTQLSQMYNLLTGYHTGSNRAAFVMLPRPHILQPTDRRTFIQGLRIIEGVQDFFLVVVRPAGQEKLKVDAHLQTGHFPENIDVIDNIPVEDQFDTKSETIGPFTRRCLGLSATEAAIGAIADAMGGNPPFIQTDVTNGVEVFDTFEVDGWEFDTDNGDPGHKPIMEHKLNADNLDDFEGISIKQIYKREIPDKITIDISVKNKNSWPSRGAAKATFSREYEVFLRKKIKTSEKYADAVGMLITQRTLCAQIKFGDCITKVPIKDLLDDHGIVFEPPFDIDDLYHIPVGINEDKVKGGIQQQRTRYDFAFKKGILRKIQQTMITAGNSPYRYNPKEVGFLQTKHFQRRLLKVLPDKILDKSVQELDFVNQEIKDRTNMSLRDFLSINDSKSALNADISHKEARELRKMLFRPQGRKKKLDND